MKISNFRDMHIVKVEFDFPICFATVTVTTGIFWWKKTVDKVIFKRASYWKFIDDGQFTPINVVEKMSDAYRAQEYLNTVAQLKNKN